MSSFLPGVHLGSNINLGVSMAALPNRNELSSTDITVLNILNSRRDSTTSTISSAYLSRRSSGISPCFSSRRSSEASQADGRLHNISVTDSYDPISTDASRRSSESSQCDEIPSFLSLTPAQQYRLKAKYAAATGGPPPTPLPNMDMMSLKTRMALLGDTRDSRLSPLSSSNVPRRCSDGGVGTFGRRHFISSELQGNGMRRASDPVKMVSANLSTGRVQRFNSLNSISTHSVAPPMERRNLALQNYTRSVYSPCPPSISENVALEAMIMEAEGNLDDEDFLPDDMVQYLNLQNQSLYENLQNGELEKQQTTAPTARNINNYDQSQMNNNSYNQVFQNVEPTDQVNNKNDLPIQWNEVTSGSAEHSPSRVRYGHRFNTQDRAFGTYNNMMVQHQIMTKSGQPQQRGYQNMQINPQALQQNLNLYNNSLSIKDQQYPITDSSYNPAIRGQKCTGNNQINNGQQNIVPSMHYTEQSSNAANSVQNQNLLNQEYLQQFATEHMIHGMYFLGVNRLNQTSVSQNSHGMEATQTFLSTSQPSGNQQVRNYQSCANNQQIYKANGIKLEMQPQQHCVNPQNYSGQFYDQTMGYTQQRVKPGSHTITEGHCLLEESSNTNASELLSPGANQVTSTVNNIDGSSLDGVQIDFDAIIDDGDHASLISGALSPSIIQNLSRNSSRLTTPRASLTFPTMPVSTSNMAIGDMSSLLTSLAEESKFLAVMQ